MPAARLILALSLLLTLFVTPANAQYEDTEHLDRPISDVRIEGLNRVSEQLVRNQLRVAVGDPYDPEIVRADTRRLTWLGEFSRITPVLELQPDGSVHVVYMVEEQAILTEVQVVGNKLISDEELLAVVQVFPGLARNNYLIQRSTREIEDLYRRRGHYLTTVTVDQQELAESGILLFRVIEGPRVRIRVLAFEGNTAFRDERLRSEIKTRAAVPLLNKGVLDEDVLAEDVATIDRFYKDRGFLDVRVDRRIELSPDNREAKITFLVAEGRQYTLRAVRATTMNDEPLRQYTVEQITALLELRPGDIYSKDLVRKSVTVIEESYGGMGYLGVVVRPYELRSSEEPTIDLHLRIAEGERAKVGMVIVQGNTLTEDRVIRREVRSRPGRPLDVTELERTRRRIRDTRLFNDPIRITVQDPRENDPEYRDLLIEVKERDTGAVNFGLAIGSDSGLFGEFSINQRNFDVTDYPESINELVRGAAFRGGGQRFSMVLRPGNEIFQYAMSLTEPNLFDTDYSLSVSGSFNAREYDEYDEERITGTVSVGRRIGDIWNASVRLRAEEVQLSDVEASAPTEIFRDAGPDALTSVGLTLSRSTLGTVIRPGRGSRLEFSIDQVGAFGGEFEFSRATIDYTVFLTVREDFLGRISTLKLNTQAGYIFGGGRAPTYERLYLGGRSLRGFPFREISPKGIRNDNGQPSDEPIGGTWSFAAGVQYEFPVFEEVLSGVVFLDSGTVLDDFGFEDYRVSVGAGIRMVVPALGPVPIAFDFAFPLQDLDTDDTQVFSFRAELPWR